METLQEAYERARTNIGAPGIDGVTFADIEAQGVVPFLVQMQDELTERTYVPVRARKTEIPKDGARSASCRSLPSVTAWCKVRSG